MSYLEKRHVSHKAGMQNHSYLDSFMDETDREVMSLTDRAFKSLCIGDEAIYNDSGLSPSPVEWHKPLAEDKPKKIREKLFSDYKNNGLHLANGLTSKPWEMIENSSKLSSLFGSFPSKKIDGANGDSWDKSALLSIQKELSEFSYQNHFADEQFHHSKNHLKSSDYKICKDTSMQLGKSSKNKQSKTSKFSKLNIKNSFLHSEFSAFRYWGDLNRFRLDNFTQNFFQNKCPAELYDSQLHKELAASNKSPAPWSVREMGQKTSTPEPQHEPKPKMSQQTIQTLSVEEPKKQTETHMTPKPQLQASSRLVQRCQSDGEMSAPWRKNRREKGVIPTFRSSPVSEKKLKDKDIMQNRKEVKMMEEPASTSSTPFSISQLLTPVIPSRQGTETSEVLQALFSPLAADLPRLLEVEACPSPEIKRESYKAIASGLLFNLKDNRKRVKAMYSPQKFKSSSCSTEQNKPASLVELDTTKNHKLPVPQISDAKLTSPLSQHACLSPSRPETTEMQISPCTPCNVPLNSSLPDDFLGLSLLQDGGLKSKQSPIVKSSYPSLNLYHKSALAKSDTAAIPVDVPVSNGEQCRVQERSQSLIQPETNEINNTRQPEIVLTEATQKVEAVSASSNKDKMNVGGTGKIEQIYTKDEESCRKDTKTKHSFSARQNNYIKSQRYVNGDEEETANARQTRERIRLEEEDSARKVEQIIDKQEEKELRQKKLDNQNDPHSIYLNDDLGTSSEQRMSKNNALSMKGNTSAKIALFDLKDKEPSKTHQVPESKKESIVIDKYRQATVALDDMIARREQTRKLSNSISSTDTDEINAYKGDQKLSLEEDCKQESLIYASESVTADKRGQKTIYDFKPTSQNVQSMPDTNTKHGECHEPGVKLAEACEQEGAAKHSRHKTGLIKPGEVDASGRLSQQAEADEVQSDSTVVFRSLDNLTKQGSSYKPEVTLRKDKANSQSGDRGGDELEGNEFVGERENEEFVSANKVKNVKSNMQNKRELLKRHRDVLESLPEPRKNAGESLIQVECLKNYVKQDNRKQNVVTPSQTFGAADIDAVLIKQDTVELPDKDLTLDVRHAEDLHRKSLTVSAVQNALNVPDDLLVVADQLKSGRRSKISIGSFNDLVDKSDDEQVRPDQYKEIGQTLESGTHVDALNVSENMSDILKQSRQSNLQDNQSSDYFKQSCDNCEGNLEQTTDSCSESKSKSSGIVSTPTNESEKGGWVQCLIDSGKIQTPTCQSNASSPTMGKPALFRVKDNTFSASPVIKTVRPTLHKTVSGMTQPWSPRDSLSGSERGEEDPDLFKDCLHIQSPIHQPNKVHSQAKFHPASQFTPAQKITEPLDGYTVPEVEEWESATNSVPQGIESCRTNAGDTTEELTFSTAPTESIEGAKTPSERSESVCSGNEHQTQNKPPTVPPKSEKALRRAMKLTSRRIQKATETKNKSERGRRSEKSASQKHERRHHSSDRVLSKQSSPREQSINQGGNQRTGEDSTQTLLPESQAGAIRSSKLDSQSNESRKPKPGSHQQDAKNFTVKSADKSHFDVMDDGVCGERLGRISEKYVPDKVSRRAQSLDRFSHGKHDQRFSNSADFANTDTSQTVSSPQRAPFHLSRQNSMELMYTPSANNIITQSFPITQRKLLQDPDSGQYFVVDMPVKVKTKTFFDPETGSYVQLPVQSLDVQSQAMEVLKAPTLMLYHGYVPMPGSGLAQQNSMANAVNPDYLDAFEPSEIENNVDVYQKHHTMNEHLPQDDFDLDLGNRH